jgi:hypothetical protein
LTEPFFMLFEGNFTYRVDGYRRAARIQCTIAGIPTVQNSTLVDIAPRLATAGQPWCLSKENGLVQAVIGIGMLLMAAGATRFALRFTGAAGVRRLFSANTGARATCESCF